jgi:chloramphenicol 3-O-phosphotransferase
MTDNWELSMPHLVVIYGAPLTGKSSLAREVAGALEGKSAVVGVDAMLEDAIRVHDPDGRAELEMVLTQARLLVANYLKNGYHTVLEGAFYYERDGVLHRHEQEIDQTLALMRNLARSPMVVRLSASAETLQRRADAGDRPRDVAGALRIDAAYKQRGGSSSLHLTTDEVSVAGLASDVLGRLGVG